MTTIELNLDSVDASGEQQLNIMHSIHKVPVDGFGNLVGIRHKHSLEIHANQEYSPLNDPRSPFYCGSCYDAPVREGECCNRCEDVIRKYKQANLPLPRLEEIDQCIDEVSRANPGCNIHGSILVQKVAGNFHFAPGRSFSQEHETHVHHIHEFNPMLVSRFNTSHIIHSLSFGERIPFVEYPLDSHAQYTNGMAIHKYFIKVVPTTYIPGGLLGREVETYQFSVTKFIQQVDTLKRIFLPGL